MTNTIKKLDFATVSAMTASERDKLFSADGLEVASANFAAHADSVLWNMTLAFVTDPVESASGFARFITALNSAKSRQSKARSEYNKGKTGNAKRGATASEQSFASIVKRFNDYMHWGLGYTVEKGILHGGANGPTHYRAPGYTTLGAIANDKASTDKVREMVKVEMNVPSLDMAAVLAKGTVLDAGYGKPKLAPLESKLIKVYREVTAPADKRNAASIDEAITAYNDEVRKVEAGTGKVSKDTSITIATSAIDAMREAVERTLATLAPIPNEDVTPDGEGVAEAGADEVSSDETATERNAA